MVVSCAAAAFITYLHLYAKQAADLRVVVSEAAVERGHGLHASIIKLEVKESTLWIVAQSFAHLLCQFAKS